MTERPAPGVRATRPPRRWRLVGLVALALVVVAGVVTAVVLMTKQSEEEKAEDAIVEGFTRWAEAEGGDADACDGMDDYFVHEDGSAEDACRSEVGSHDGDIPEVVADRIELDGNKGTARVTFTGLSADGGSGEDLSYPLELTRVDGRWKVVGG